MNQILIRELNWYTHETRESRIMTQNKKKKGDENKNQQIKQQQQIW